MLGFCGKVRKFNFVEFDAESADIIYRFCFQCFGWMRKIFFNSRVGWR